MIYAVSRSSRDTAFFVGGIVCGGPVFELTQDDQKSVLWNSCPLQNCNAREFPRAGLIRDKAGHHYGTTLWGETVVTVVSLRK